MTYKPCFSHTTCRHKSHMIAINHIFYQLPRFDRPVTKVPRRHVTTYDKGILVHVDLLFYNYCFMIIIL